MAFVRRSCSSPWVCVDVKGFVCRGRGRDAIFVILICNDFSLLLFRCQICRGRFSRWWLAGVFLKDFCRAAPTRWVHNSYLCTRDNPFVPARLMQVSESSNYAIGNDCDWAINSINYNSSLALALHHVRRLLQKVFPRNLPRSFSTHTRRAT